MIYITYFTYYTHITYHSPTSSPRKKGSFSRNRGSVRHAESTYFCTIENI